MTKRPIRKTRKPPTKVIGIDPGNGDSAWLTLDLETKHPEAFALQSNEEVLGWLGTHSILDPQSSSTILAIEMMRPRGMPTAWEEFETCVWIGRFIQAWGRPWLYIFRSEVKSAICGKGNARDSNIRQALIDQYGGKEEAIGRKADAGPLYGIKKDIWSALAIAMTYAKTHQG